MFGDYTFKICTPSPGGQYISNAIFPSKISRWVTSGPDWSGSHQALRNFGVNYLILQCHYDDIIMSTMASQMTSLSIVCSSVCSGADQRKHQSFASLAFVRGIHRGPVNSPHKGPVTRKMFPFDDVIMVRQYNAAGA